MNISDSDFLIIVFVCLAVYFGVKDLKKKIDRRFGDSELSEIKENAKETIEKYKSEYEKNDKVRKLLATVNDSDQEIIDKSKLVLNWYYTVDNEEDGLVNLWCNELTPFSSALRSVLMTRELAELLIQAATLNIVMKMLDMERRIAVSNSLLNHAAPDFDFAKAVDYEIERDDYWHRIQEIKSERANIISKISSYLVSVKA